VSGKLDIRNLIRQWNSKRNEIGIEDILLAIYGTEVTKSHRKLAKTLTS